MLSLGIDTSTKVGALALVQDNRLLLENTIDAKLNHSARLLPTLESALEKAGLSRSDLDCIGVGIGPGSLTGVRVGIAFAKGLVFAIRKPLVGVCSLEAIACRRKGHPGVISVIVDAKMGGFYHVAYRWDADRIEEVSPLSVFSRGDLPEKLTPGSLVLSPDAQGIPTELAAGFPANCRMAPEPVFPSAEYIARRAILEATDERFTPERMIEPIYLRPGVPGRAKLP